MKMMSRILFGYKNDAKEPPEYNTWVAFIMSIYWFVAQW